MDIEDWGRTFHHDPSMDRYNIFFLYKDNEVPYLGRMSLGPDDYCRLVDKHNDPFASSIVFIFIDENARIHTLRNFDIFSNRDGAMSMFARRMEV